MEERCTQDNLGFYNDLFYAGTKDIPVVDHFIGLAQQAASLTAYTRNDGRKIPGRSFNQWHDGLTHSNIDVRQEFCYDFVHHPAGPYRVLEWEVEEHAIHGRCHQAIAFEYSHTNDLFLFLGASWGWYYGAAVMTNEPDKVQCYAGWLQIAMHGEIGFGWNHGIATTNAAYVDMAAIKGEALIYDVGFEPELGISVSHTHVHITDRSNRMIGKGLAIGEGVGISVAIPLIGFNLFANTYTPYLVDPIHKIRAAPGTPCNTHSECASELCSLWTNEWTAVCCPRDEWESINWKGWCDKLEEGEACVHDKQCNSKPGLGCGNSHCVTTCDCMGGGGYGGTCTKEDYHTEWCFLSAATRHTCSGAVKSNNGVDYWSTTPC